jgi:hypothetical protein
LGAAFALLRTKNVLQRLKPFSKNASYGTAEEGAEKVIFETKGIPQRLKPHYK